MIEQAYVQAVDQTTPTIQAIRARISQAVDATRGPALDRLKYWLQMPTASTFTMMIDGNCQGRAKELGVLLSTLAGGLHEPSDLSKPAGIEGKWAAIDDAVKADRAVSIQGKTEHVSGSKSHFNKVENGLGFHVIVFLAVGQESSGRRYYLGFDPDVSATEESRKKWIPLVVGDTEGTVAKKVDDPRSIQIIKDMILGDSPDGFGPLVRKYYVETDKAFHKISRV